MEFARFIEIPMETKIQIINKCSPISYVRLRGTCRFVDEFCEKNRNRLGVYCPNHKLVAILLNNPPHVRVKTVRWKARENKKVKIPLTPDNMVKINKTFSGLIVAQLNLNNYPKDNNYNTALNYFLEAVPNLKVNFMQCHSSTVEQVERVISSKWKIGGVRINGKLEMLKILQIDAIRKMDPLCCHWEDGEDNFTEQDIIQLARGKKRMILNPKFLSTSSSLNVLKTIAQNWRKDGHFPISFRMTWETKDKNYMNADISSLYSEIMDMEAYYLGSFLESNRDIFPSGIDDIWIRKEKTQWQIVRIKRYDLDYYGIGAFFSLKTADSMTSFIQIWNNLLYEIHGTTISKEPSFYEACLTENMEKIKEAFVAVTQKQLP